MSTGESTHPHIKSRGFLEPTDVCVAAAWRRDLYDRNTLPHTSQGTQASGLPEHTRPIKVNRIRKVSKTHRLWWLASSDPLALGDGERGTPDQRPKTPVTVDIRGMKPIVVSLRCPEPSWVHRVVAWEECVE